MNIPKPQIVRKPRTVLQGAVGNKGDEYTIPRTRYNYQKVSWDVFMSTKNEYKSIRSSIIPYTSIDNEKYWVLGSFHDFPGDILMDFGGSCIIFDKSKREIVKNYQHPFGCAMLELYEESKGLLVKPVLAALSGDNVIIYRGSNDQRKEYVWFIIVYLNYETVKSVIDRFPEAPYVSDELLGPLGIYKATDILNKKHRTSRNLTDFVDYLTHPQ
jgi:hypothetical protein